MYDYNDYDEVSNYDVGEEATGKAEGLLLQGRE